MAYRLAERSALSNCNRITLLYTECWTDVRSQVRVSLLVSCIFRDEVEVFSADDQGSVHLCGDDGASEDSASNGDHAGEWAFLVWEQTSRQQLCFEIT